VIRQFFNSFVVLLIGLLLLVRPAVAITLSDDRGIELSLATPAERIIALAPHLTEMAYAAGAGTKVVGVSRFSNFPDAARRLPQVGDAAYIDLERIVALRPDLILAWKSGNRARDVARLEQLGFRVFVTEPSRLEDIPRLLRAIGTLAGTGRAAEREADNFIIIIRELRGYYGWRRPVRVFYEIWNSPLLTVSGKHMISDVLAACGGRNVFADAPTLTPTVSVEGVLAAHPDVILGGGSAESEKKFIGLWRTSVVKELRDTPVFYIAPDTIQRPTPRILEGARKVCEDLQAVRERKEKSQDH